MVASSAMLIIDSYNQTHQRILDFARRLSDEQLHWRQHEAHLSIAFHVWHVGRWADYFQACLPGMTDELRQRLPAGTQLWDTEGLAQNWGFNSAQLGFAQTAMDMPDELALRLPLPSKDPLLDYVERAFSLAQRSVAALDEVQLQTAEQPQPLTEGIWGGGTVGDALMVHVTHDNRHLGMMECLLGLQGQRGTATR